VASALYGAVITISNHGNTPIWAPEVMSCTLPALPDVMWTSRSRGAAREVLGPAEEVEVRGDWVKADDENVRVHGVSAESINRWRNHFVDAGKAAMETARFRDIYNRIRPHQSLGDRTPRQAYLGNT
jgi:hypothetical protein